MKIYLTFFALFLFGQFAFGQNDTVVINNTTFITTRKTRENSVGTKDTLILLYRLENGKRKYLLTHYLYAKDADCNNVFTDIGTMTVRNDSLIFMKHYLQTKKNRDPIPEWRKQIYKVTSTGKLMLLYDKSKKRNFNWVNSNYNDDHKAN
ncbi:MAG: hypothetical protein J0I09_07425 [Sphingobacteriia bacterium]|nr:hypothetical protein [Sphingobacteriia bacterium]